MPTDWHRRIAPDMAMEAGGFKWADESALAHCALQDRKGPASCVSEYMELPHRFNSGNRRVNSLETARRVLQGHEWPYDFIDGDMFMNPDVVSDSWADIGRP